MDKEMLEQFQILLDAMGAMETRMEGKLKASETRTQVFIENSVNKRIDALFDGYKLTHEKQYELERDFERKTELMQREINNLEARLAALEAKIA